ncbi:putative transposase L79 [Phytophthora citrophthora]|uniref:Transposase L79 n=1 Tax=Phytophthora citrophthora TaxID=4793 RepID=A0AAD9H1C2_9STRA|nr:putative transposase L79 [Phytophthora citrophthora]
MASARPRSRPREDFVHSSEWFQRAIADDLWMPEVTEGAGRRRRRRRYRRVRPKKLKRRKRQKRGRYPKRPPTFVRDRVQDHLRVVESLLTSWFDIGNFANDDIHGEWRTNNMPPPADTVEPDDEMTDTDDEDEEDSTPVNSILKLRLFPTSSQKQKLDQMFASNRAIYNKLVACSKDDRLGITTWKRMSLSALCTKYRPIAVSMSMSKYFKNNKKALARHRQVHDEVRDSAYRDFKRAVKSSRALFFAMKAKGEETKYPDMKFKSKFAPSNTIETRSRSIRPIDREGKQLVRFHKTFFRFKKNEGIMLHETLPELTTSIRLQRLREGEFYIIVPRLREFPQLECTRSCAIDPGVRNFVTVYDPNGRTFSVKDSSNVLKKKFEAVDKMKSMLQVMDNACKARHPTKVRTKAKKGSKSCKTAEHRFRYRMRRRIRYTSRKATRLVNDMHHKLSSWLASKYQNVLLPSFQTSEMVRRYELEVASDATPETPATIQKRKIRSPIARAMLAQAHYKFKMLLKYKLQRAGGRLITCEEEYTSKTCSSCGEIKENLGGSDVFRCSSCHARHDRDVNAAKNIFHKNVALLP